MSETSQIMHFNLNKKDDCAIIRLYHTSVKTIEHAIIHNIKVNDKKRSIKCIGENCPICKNGNNSIERVYIHLFDYTDNKEKVWVRTDKILSQFETIEKDWGDLSKCVLKITRLTDDFPKYEVSIMPPTSYESINQELIDKSIAYRFYMSRKQDEIDTFLATGEFPIRNKEQKQEYIPKSEYKKDTNTSSSHFSGVYKNINVNTQSTFNIEDDFDPFNVIPKKV
jgi:hypothetical protein